MPDNRKPKRRNGTRRWQPGFNNAQCPVYGNAVGNCTTLEPTVFGYQAFGPFYNGYSVTCSVCCAVLGIRPNVDDVARAVVAKLTK
jgi:hypothetical protein